MEILIMCVAVMVNLPLPLTAIQLLWVNLTTDGLPALALGVDPGDPDIMEKKPRNPNESVFTRDVKLYLTAVPILMTTLLLASFVYHQPWLNAEAEVEARTLMFNAMVFMELANALNARSLKHTILKVGVFRNKFLWLAILSSVSLQFAVLYIPQLHAAFDITYPDMFDWVVAISFTAFVFFAVEIGKYIGSRKSGS